LLGLEEMENTRLMNRIDTKYLMSLRKVPELLTRMDADSDGLYSDGIYTPGTKYTSFTVSSVSTKIY